jgi:hypothetical protein
MLRPFFGSGAGRDFSTCFDRAVLMDAVHRVRLA